MMMSANRCARPVIVTTPTMMPAAAHVAATLSTPVVPSANAATSFDGVSALSRRR